VGFRDAIIPDLSSLNVPLKAPLLAQLLVGIVKNDQRGLYIREYTRLVDKAVFEYERARLAIEAQKAGTNQLQFLEFIDGFETCLNAIARLLRLRALLAKVSREEEANPQPVSDAIRNVRNRIEHMDADIAGAKAGKDWPVMLSISESGQAAIVGNRSVEFCEVSRCIRELHCYCVQVLSEGSGVPIPFERDM